MDLHKTENREAHKTDEYEIKNLILRRGQVFDVTATFNREYLPQSDVITLQFVAGNVNKIYLSVFAQIEIFI